MALPPHCVSRDGPIRFFPAYSELFAQQVEIVGANRSGLGHGAFQSLPGDRPGAVEFVLPEVPAAPAKDSNPDSNGAITAAAFAAGGGSPVWTRR
jgi:hypothetical protein